MFLLRLHPHLYYGHDRHSAGISGKCDGKRWHSAHFREDLCSSRRRFQLGCRHRSTRFRLCRERRPLHRCPQTDLRAPPIHEIAPEDNPSQNRETGKTKPLTSGRVGDAGQYGKFLGIESLIQAPSFQNVLKRYSAKLFVQWHFIRSHSSSEFHGAMSDNQKRPELRLPPDSRGGQGKRTNNPANGNIASSQDSRIHPVGDTSSRAERTGEIKLISSPDGP